MKETTWQRDLRELEGLGIDVLTKEEQHLRRLPIVDIRTKEGLFQPRIFDDDVARSRREAHIRELASNLVTCGGLEPITVMKLGGQWWCIDGHHRLSAYRMVREQREQAGGRGKRLTHIPVTVFSGSLDAALDESLRENVKNRACMTQQEKLEKAWERVLRGSLQVPEIVTRTTVSRSMVFKMRQYLRRAQESHPEMDFNTWTWEGVQRMVDGLEEHRRADDWEDKLAAKWNRMLQRTLGEHYQRHPRVLAKALVLAGVTFAKETAGETLAECRKATPETDDF